jgi:dimethylhistidine N-methyltransferase
MPSTYRIIDEKDYADSFKEKDSLALDVLVGLSETHKSIPSKYLYDENGSQLFKAITRLPEYYLTNCELEILEKYKEDIAQFVADQPFNLVELGPGEARKTESLLAYYIQSNLQFQYVPIDISEPAMGELVKSMDKRFPQLETNGLVSDYFTGLKWLNNRFKRIDFILFLGSSIGNFNHAQSRNFLRNVWNCLSHNDLILIGFDLKKDIELLLYAYNDSKGMTKEFNLNILRRINRELKGNFDLSRFRHFGTYDVFQGAMQSYLVSLEDQEVYVEQIRRSFQFKAWEPIHIEYSYKYSLFDVETLARETGFILEKSFFDSRGYFMDSLWRVNKPGPK